jgi:hypothetical protein
MNNIKLYILDRRKLYNMNKEKGFKFDITIDNGIGLIIAGILIPLLAKVALWIVPILLVVFGVVQIVRGHAQEGVPNIIIAGIIWLVSRLARWLISWLGGITIVIGVVVLIIAIIQRNKKKNPENNPDL